MNIKIFSLIIVFISISSVTQAQTAFEEDFETKANGLDLTTEGYQLSKDVNYSGNITATVTENSGNKFARMLASTNGGAKMQIAKTIDVVAGKTYTFEMESKGPFKRQLRVFSISDELIQVSSDYKPSTAQEETSWKKMSVSFYVPNGVSSVKIAFYHYWSGTIDLDNIKVFEILRQTKYYLSSAGDDSGSGNIDAPWASLYKISDTPLFPGDKVFFNRGDRFDGHFVINGSGEMNNPITITSYGSGNKPIISGEVGAAGGSDYKEAILIENNDNITIEDIEVRNDREVARSGVADTDGFGISIDNSSDQIMKNFIFRNIIVKNVFAVQPMLNPEDFDAIQVSGIRFTCSKNTEIGKEKNIQNILIEDSYFTNLQRLGIQFKHSGGNEGVGNDEINRNKDIIVRNNEFYYNGGSAVLPNRTYNCLIENNIIDHPGATTDSRMPGRGSSVWNIWSINTVVQYNMCLSTRGYLDSYGIHIDKENENTFVQYNYMDDCEGGFVEILAGNKNAVYRFNVSVNSGFRVSNWANSNCTIYVYSDRWVDPPNSLNLNDGVYINNNTVVINKGTKPNGDSFTTSISLDGKNMFVYNNIFSSTNGSGMGANNFAINANGTPLTVTNNLFEGTVNPDWINTDTNPQIGSALFTSVGEHKFAFQVHENSLAVNNGISIQGPVLLGAGTGVFENVPAYPNVDFYGNPIDLASGTPNIGAYNGKSNDDLLSNKNNISKLDLSWRVYPNSEVSELVITNPALKSNAPLELKLANLKGQIVMSKKIVKHENQYRLKLPLGLSNGIYVLNLNIDTISHSRKIILHK
ncbi:right-handed parallel beta-helix repeat-containing protein [Tamlana fucoidanivorans]|uniref:T9SS type A sorting domain-containing protein n=1 Tax=Allotamlana fucoidanivorans TaxID=2583814 RepID=A0A5C4SHI4_9FLAO|nr:T9SS type A sorting domain-containing protein [Tamlana fucoidanivorans]TNJ43147.1 T9SS type A sorting domain-containing protein [Tamlana fucoidanivorans]